MPGPGADIITDGPAKDASESFVTRTIAQALADYGHAYGLKSVALRYFNASGADPEGEIGEDHTPETHLIPLAIRSAFNGPQLKVFGTDFATTDGTAVRDYVHVEDVANAHLLAANYLESGGKSETFNLGTGVGYSIKEIIALVEKVTGNRVIFQFGDRRPGDPPLLVANISFAKEVLQFEPKHDIISIIGTAYNWETRDDNEQ